MTGPRSFSTFVVSWSTSSDVVRLITAYLIITASIGQLSRVNPNKFSKDKATDPKQVRTRKHGSGKKHRKTLMADNEMLKMKTT